MTDNAYHPLRISSIIQALVNVAPSGGITDRYSLDELMSEGSTKSLPPGGDDI